MELILFVNLELMSFRCVHLSSQETCWSVWRSTTSGNFRIYSTSFWFLWLFATFSFPFQSCHSGSSSTIWVSENSILAVVLKMSKTYICITQRWMHLSLRITTRMYPITYLTHTSDTSSPAYPILPNFSTLPLVPIPHPHHSLPSFLEMSSPVLSRSLEKRMSAESFFCSFMIFRVFLHINLFLPSFSPHS